MPPLPDPAAQPTYAVSPHAPAYVRPLPTGRMSWALGFLAYIPIPWVNTLVTGIVMAAVYPSTRRKGVPVATENARIAANWGLTCILVMLLCLVYTFGMLVFGSQEVKTGFLPIGWGAVAYMLLGLVHLIVTIMGTVVAGRGEVFRNLLAIPFIRAKRH